MQTSAVCLSVHRFTLNISRETKIPKTGSAPMFKSNKRLNNVQNKKKKEKKIILDKLIGYQYF